MDEKQFAQVDWDTVTAEVVSSEVLKQIPPYKRGTRFTLVIYTDKLPRTVFSVFCEGFVLGEKMCEKFRGVGWLPGLSTYDVTGRALEALELMRQYGENLG